MKKTYMKPEIMFEDFSLCTSIAANCEIKIDNHSSGGCGQPIEGLPGQFLFISADTGCTRCIPDEGTDGFCYHVPIESNNLFNS